MKIVVRGRGPFPIDMLRFAEAWPADSESVARIHNSIARDVIGEHGAVGDITLYTGEGHINQHLLNRWQSFGWHAYVIEDGTVLMTTDPKQPRGEELRPAGEPIRTAALNPAGEAAARRFAESLKPTIDRGEG